MREPAPRIAAFVLVSAALVALAPLLAPRDAEGPPARLPAPALAPRNTAMLSAARRKGALATIAARRFVAAYLRCEAGERSAAVRAAVSGTATPAFARDLLADQGRQAGPAPAASARIDRIDLSFLTTSGRRALVTGLARRPDGPEEFAFVFERRGGRWLAVGAAE